MEASSAYQYAKERGSEQEQRATLQQEKQVQLDVCVARFGENLPSDVRTRIEGQSNLGIVRRAIARTVNASTFDEVAEILNTTQQQ